MEGYTNEFISDIIIVSIASHPQTDRERERDSEDEEGNGYNKQASCVSTLTDGQT